MSIDTLIPKYRAMAQASTENFHGLSILQHADSIGKMVRALRAKTLLDFGCGRADAYRAPHNVWQAWGIPRDGVTLYDPAFRRDNELPTGTFDVVVCSDVLEHVPEDEVVAFAERLASYARHGLWASVCCRPAKKKFPDGGNLHVTVRSYDWWLDKMQAAANRHNVLLTLIETP
jgi:SAM-dependent methyltransferase